MEIEIEELVSSVHAVDGEAVLAPAVMREIVRIVTAAVRSDLAHEQRLQRERRLQQDPRTSAET